MLFRLWSELKQTDLLSGNVYNDLHIIRKILTRWQAIWYNGAMIQAGEKKKEPILLYFYCESCEAMRLLFIASGGIIPKLVKCSRCSTKYLLRSCFFIEGCEAIKREKATIVLPPCTANHIRQETHPLSS